MDARFLERCHSSETSFERFETPLAAIAETIVSKTRPGRVRCEGSHWPARLFEASPVEILHAGQPVVAIARDGITLLVTLLK